MLKFIARFPRCFGINILQIKKERSDENGVELWFPLMMGYLKDSPYGKHHDYEDVHDLIHHLTRRRNDFAGKTI